MIRLGWIFLKCVDMLFLPGVPKCAKDQVRISFREPRFSDYRKEGAVKKVNPSGADRFERAVCFIQGAS